MALWEYKDLSLKARAEGSAALWRGKILSLVQKEDPDGHFSSNFAKHMSFDFSLYQAFIVILRDGELLGFSSVCRMPCWPETAVRIYNRYYMSLKVRKMFQTGGLEGSIGYKKGPSAARRQNSALQAAAGQGAARLPAAGGIAAESQSSAKPYIPITAPLYQRMLAAARKAGAKTALVTRPNKGQAQAIRAIHLKMLLNDSGWRLSPDYVLTCKYRERPECWQRYVYLPLGAGGGDELLPKISAAEYKRRFMGSDPV